MMKKNLAASATSSVPFSIKPRDQPILDFWNNGNGLQVFASCIWFLIARLNLEFWHCVYPMFKTCPEQNQTSPKRMSSRRMELSPSATKMEQCSPALIGSNTIDHSAPSEAQCHHLGCSIFWMGRRLQFHISGSDVIFLNIPCPLSTYWGRGRGGDKTRLTRDLHSHLKDN